MRLFDVIAVSLLGCGLLHAQTNSPVVTTPVANPNSAPSIPQGTLGEAFRTACWKGDLAEVTRLLDQGAPIEGRDNQGRTGLFLACHGSPDVVKFLMSRGAKIDVTAFNGDTTVGRACENGDLATAQMLVTAGGDTSSANQYGRTPLMLACREGHDSLVAFLIAQHVDVNAEGTSDPAIVYAVNKDHPSIVKLLLDAGAHVTTLVRASIPNRFHGPLLALAAWTDDLALIDLLLDHGADINGVGADGVMVISEALHGAKPETIQHLLEKGADPNLGDAEGQTGFMYATNYKFPILQSFLDHGAKMETKDKKGRTALMWASFHGNSTSVQFLIDHGADVNAADSSGNTALTYASDRGDLDIVQLLKDKGAQQAELRILAKDKPVPPLSPAHSWALAVGAIYPQTNGSNPNMLGYADKSNILGSFKKQWNITDKASFLKVIDGLRTKGHHAEFLEVGAKLAAMPDADFSAKVATMDPADAGQAKAIRAAYQKWQDRTGLAWDLCRAANLVNLAYQIHYLDEQEAWDLLMPIAQQTQSGFTSWQEMSDNFLDGREIWDNARDPKFEACAKLLLNPADPNSPWNENPWKTDLSASTTGQ